MDDDPFKAPCPSFATMPQGQRPYFSDQHHDILAMATAWSSGPRPILALLGAPGIGKTLLASEFAERTRRRMRVGWVDCATASVDLADEVPKALGITTADPLQGLADLLARCSANRQTCLLVVDDAQRLTKSSLEFLEDLTAGPGLPLPIYVLLVGTEDLATLLDWPAPESLQQRIGGHLRLQPFTEAETGDYIAHRFRAAGCSCHGGRSPFDARGVAMLHAASQGYPVNINLLVQRCLSTLRPAPDGKIDAPAVHRCLTFMAKAGSLPYPLPALPTVEEFEERQSLQAVVPSDQRQDLHFGNIIADPRYHWTDVEDDLAAGRTRRWLTLGVASVGLVAALVVGSNLMIPADNPATVQGDLVSANSETPAVEPALQPEPPAPPVDTVVEEKDVDPQALLLQALSAGAEDPAAAIPFYTRAALWGNQRAAYYLGQLYETGTGVAVDLDRARAWYGLAPDIEGAAERVAILAEDGAAADPADLVAPVPQRQVRFPWNRTELYWQAAPGAEPVRYKVEFVAAGSDQVQQFETELQAALVRQRVSRWRVIAMQADGTEGPASAWISFDRVIP
ncbi:AAA family ATPase [Paracoccus rhizosphaerae]|uniref:AAA family ATPase n=1 Tax=Paracoccus rhizosphaerae TaxID=1133347 RepID=A0ABV6CR89_9RHOB|nr:AAA family ATPase [Paracoccus rhizosphaerae]